MKLFSWNRPLSSSARLTAPDHELVLRMPTGDDFVEWKQVRKASREFLEPWEPTWPKDDLTRMGYRRRMRHIERESNNGTQLSYFIFHGREHKLIGGISAFNIRRGAARTCTIGYWMAQSHAGQGLMGAALATLCQHLFDQHKIERIEAASLPDNLRSVRLLEKSGFQFEGLVRNYLQINGKRRDHALYSLVRETDITKA